MGSSRTFLQTLTMAIAMATAAVSDVTSVYVSPDGDDSRTGLRPEEPVASLSRARDRARELKGEGVSGPITVLLRQGVHRLTSPLVLGPEDAGTEAAPVIWSAYPGEDAVVSGARAITEWRERDDGRWVASLPTVAAGKWNFKTLYVNGERRERPRYPQDGYLRIAAWPSADQPPWNAPGDHFTFAAGDIQADWHNLGDIEAVVLRFWVSSRQPIASVDEGANTVHFTRATRYRYSDDFGDKGARYFLENVYEELSPGQWYLDRPAGELIYHPLEGEDVSSLRVEAPVSGQLIRIEGDPAASQFVRGIRFHDLTFTHNNWGLPDDDPGDGQSAPTVEGALSLTGAVGCSIENCRLVQLSSYAIQIDQGCRENRIVGNEIGDLGGGGIRMGGGDASSHPDLRTGGNLIAHNRIHHIGRIHHAATGVWIQHSGGNTITHNEIDHTFYSSIAIGWVWGYRPSVTTHNEISYNHIHHVGQGVLSDMGGIYMLGVAPGTVVRNNHIHDIESHGYGGWGIYTDEGSSHVLIENNIVHHTNCASFDQHYGRQNIVRNNIFAFGGEDAIHRSRIEEHISFNVERNIVYWTGETPLLDGQWEDKRYEHRPGKPWVDPEPTAETERFDYNLYFNPDKPAGQLRFGEWTLEQWRARGQDEHSLYADPGFANPASGDFTLAPDSPAFGLGFEAINISTVGPQQGRAVKGDSR